MGEITRMDVRGSLSTSYIWTASEQTRQCSHSKQLRKEISREIVIGTKEKVECFFQEMKNILYDLRLQNI